MVGRTLARTLFVVALASATLFAQELKKAPAQGNRSNKIIANHELDNSRANIVIFSNLGTGTTVYNAAVGGYYISGPLAIDNPTDQWIGIPFTNKVADHVTQIQMAVGWISGTKRVVLGIYTDNPGVGPGTLVVQKATVQIPTSGTCCQLTQVAVPSTALLAATKYWVVATTDDTAAPDFEGVAQATYASDIGGDVAQGGWFTFSGLVPAAAVKGTNP